MPKVCNNSYILRTAFNSHDHCACVFNIIFVHFGHHFVCMSVIVYDDVRALLSDYLISGVHQLNVLAPPIYTSTAFIFSTYIKAASITI